MRYLRSTDGLHHLHRQKYLHALHQSLHLTLDIQQSYEPVQKHVLPQTWQKSLQTESYRFGEIYLAYTIFKNTVVQIPTLTKLLPINAEDIVSEEEDISESPIDKLTLMNYEPEPEEALNAIIPKYINSLIFGGLVESHASENGARMQAMDSATSNAEEMISDLSLKYNRARQASITQELTEIIAGASAIS